MVYQDKPNCVYFYWSRNNNGFCKHVDNKYGGKNGICWMKEYCELYKVKEKRD